MSIAVGFQILLALPTNWCYVMLASIGGPTHSWTPRGELVWRAGLIAIVIPPIHLTRLAGDERGTQVQSYFEPENVL